MDRIKHRGLLLVVEGKAYRIVYRLAEFLESLSYQVAKAQQEHTIIFKNIKM